MDTILLLIIINKINNIFRKEEIEESPILYFIYVIGEIASAIYIILIGLVAIKNLIPQ